MVWKRLLCWLVRTAAKELTLRPQTADQAALAPIEGWIHLPEKGSLGQLARD